MCLGCGVEHAACEIDGRIGCVEGQDGNGLCSCPTGSHQVGVVAHGQSLRLADGSHRHTDGIGLAGRQGHIERQQWCVVFAHHGSEVAAGCAGSQLPIQLPGATGGGQRTEISVRIGQVGQICARQTPGQFPIRHLDGQHHGGRQRFDGRLLDVRWRGRQHGGTHPENIFHGFDAPLGRAQGAGVDAGDAHHHLIHTQAWPVQQEHIARQRRTFQGVACHRQTHPGQRRTQGAQVTQGQPRGQWPVINARIVAALIDHAALQLDGGQVLDRDGSITAGLPVGVDHGQFIGQLAPLGTFEAFQPHNFVRP